MKKSLGRPAIFLIPAEKMSYVYSTPGVPIVEKIRRFLTANFGAFQESTEHISGWWNGRFDGDFIQFKVSFLGKNKITMLDSFLEAVANEIGEESIYEETGEDAWEISPDKDKKYPAL